MFAERIATLDWLQESLLPRPQASPTEEVRILHGGLTDQEQQGLVESFKQESLTDPACWSPATWPPRASTSTSSATTSIHFDIPWSLIRIEQRNGRIDRYGQKHPPQITTLLLTPAHEKFSGDLRVLTRLLETRARGAQGPRRCRVPDGQVRRQGRGGRGDPRRAAPARRTSTTSCARPSRCSRRTTSQHARRLRRRPWIPAGRRANGRRHPRHRPRCTTPTSTSSRRPCTQAYAVPSHAPAAGGIGWRRHDQEHLVDPRAAERPSRTDSTCSPRATWPSVAWPSGLDLATSKARGKDLLAQALADGGGSSWPEAHFLAPLHPVLDWAADRALATLSRNEVFGGPRRRRPSRPSCCWAPSPTGVGQTVSAVWMSVAFPDQPTTHAPVVTVHDDPGSMFADHGIRQRTANPGAGRRRRAPDGPHRRRPWSRPVSRWPRSSRVPGRTPRGRSSCGRRRIDRWTHEADALDPGELPSSSVESGSRRSADSRPSVSPTVTWCDRSLVVVPPDHQPSRPTSPEV